MLPTCVCSFKRLNLQRQTDASVPSTKLIVLVLSRGYFAEFLQPIRVPLVLVSSTVLALMKQISLRAFLIAVAASSLTRSLFGLRDVLVPVELSFGIGPLPVFLGVQDFLIGLVVGWFFGRRKAAMAVDTATEGPRFPDGI